MRPPWPPTLEYKYRHDDIQSRFVEGTMQWVLENEDYKRWVCGGGEEGKDTLLLCRGQSGAGKTMFASFVVKHLENQRAEKYNSSSSMHGVAYFYCDYADPASLTPDNILACLGQQLLSELAPRLDDRIKDIADAYKETKSRPSISKLQEYVSRLCLEFSERVFLVIDSLDECEPATRTRILNFFRELKQSKLNILATSRTSLEEFGGCPSIEIKAMGEDVRMVLQHKIKENEDLTELLDEELRSYVIKSIQERANGVFLLSELQLESLFDCVNPNQIVEMIKCLPKNIQSAYENTINRTMRLSRYQRGLALRILLWLSHAKRPMSIDELSGVIDPYDWSPLSEDRLSPRAVVRLCMGLVEVDKASSTVHIAHCSLANYLKHFMKEKFRDPHAEIAEMCLRYLNLEELSYPCQSLTQHISRLELYPFLAYAAPYWDYHASKASAEGVRVMALRLFKDVPRLWATIQVSHYLEGDHDGAFSGFPKSLKPIHLAAQFGWEGMVADLLDENSDDIHVKDDHGRTALFWAVSGVHARGANNAIDRNDAVERYGRVIKLLLISGADNKAKDNCNTTPLIEAARNGDEEILEVLLAVTDARGGDSVRRDEGPYSDTESVESLESVVDSSFSSSQKSSSLPTSVQETGQDQLLGVLLSDEVLRPLYTEALMRMSNQKFVRNFKRLIRQYALELQHQSQNQAQREAIRLLRTRARWLAFQICKVISPTDDTTPGGVDQLLAQKPDKRHTLDRYLAEISQQATNSPAEGSHLDGLGSDEDQLPAQKPDKNHRLDQYLAESSQQATNPPAEGSHLDGLGSDDKSNNKSSDSDSRNSSSSDSGGDNCNIAEVDLIFPSIEQVRHFLVGGEPFDHLRDKLHRFVHRIRIEGRNKRLSIGVPTAATVSGAPPSEIVEPLCRVVIAIVLLDRIKRRVIAGRQFQRGVPAGDLLIGEDRAPRGSTQVFIYDRGAVERTIEGISEGTVGCLAGIRDLISYTADQFKHPIANLATAFTWGFQVIFGGLLLPHGTSRIEWTCRCGHTSYDDFTELQTGAAEALAQELRKSEVVTHANTANQDRGYFATLRYACWNMAIRLRRILKRTHESTILPTSFNPQTQATTEMHPTPPRMDPLYLLLCISSHPSGRSIATLRHLDLCRTMSDVELFTQLKMEYSSLRNRAATVRRVFSRLMNIHFVRFEVRPKELVDGLEIDILPPSEQQDYEYMPVQIKPPIGRKYLMHIYRCPEYMPEDTLCFDRFPKKKRERLFYRTRMENVGWGIYFCEGPHVAMIVTVIFVFTLVAGLVFAVCWSVLKHDIQSAWTIAAWITSTLALGLSVYLAWVMGN